MLPVFIYFWIEFFNLFWYLTAVQIFLMLFFSLKFDDHQIYPNCRRDRHQLTVERWWWNFKTDSKIAQDMDGEQKEQRPESAMT